MIRTVLGEQIIRPANDELRDQRTKLLQLLLTLRFDSICSVGISSTDDRILEVLSKVVLGTKEVRICKIKKGKVFREVILRAYISISKMDRRQNTIILLA